MRDSGVEWLARVPEHWEVRRLKTMVTNIVDPTSRRASGRFCLALENVESWTGKLRPPDEAVGFDSQLKRFRAGDILFGKLRPYLAKVTKPERDGACVGEFLVLRPLHSNTVPSYMELLLRSRPVIEEVSGSTFGAKMPRSDWMFLGGLHMPLPPLPEQRAIARFLDDADRRIRRYIKTKERLIELLEEERRATIHQAVTGRIDVRTGQPYPAYRDSGVEWLGKVPEHWEVRRLRRCVRSMGGMTPSMQTPAYWGGAIPWVTPKDMKKEAIGDSEIKVTQAALDGTSLRLVDAGGVLIVVRGMILAKRIPVAWTSKPVTINQDMKALTPAQGIAGEFLASALRSAQGVLRSFVEVAGHGTCRLPSERWRSLPITIPPANEQTAIARFLAGAGRRLSARRVSLARQIALLREYRTRLISDVVTGKLDVREAAAKLRDSAGRTDAEDASRKPTSERLRPRAPGTTAPTGSATPVRA